MKIIIDSRENTTVISRILSKYDDIDIEIKHLINGDFLLNDTILFERKTINDLLFSIKDGRLFRQVNNVSRSQIPYILIIEGTKNNIGNSKMSRASIQGALVYITVFLSIPTLFTHVECRI